MSSILKALKKIETRKAETLLPTWPHRINNRESMSRHTNRTWRHKKILGILIVVCAIALVGKLYYFSRPGPDRMAPQADLSVETTLPNVLEEKTETNRLRARTDLPDVSEQKTKANRLRARADLRDASEGKTETVRPRAKADTKPIPMSQTVYREILSNTTMDTSPVEAMIKAGLIIVPQTTPTDNNGLTLQALVWSEQPEDRFVVINDSIIREGGTINGSVVAQIEPDHVTIRSDGTTWRLKYGH